MMSGTNIEVGHGASERSDSFAAGLDAARQAASCIREHSISLALVFASVRYDLDEMLRGIQQVVPDAPILGTTTAGEICNGIRSGSVVVMLFASPYIKAAAGIGEKVSAGWGRAVLQAVSDPGLAPYFGADIGGVHKRMTLEGKQAFGIIFSPGNTRHSNSCSFEILEKLKQLSENRFPFFGGSSADDWRLESNFALCGGKAYEDSLLVAVIETSLQFGMALNHGFKPGTERAVITRAEGHEIKELNDRPAAAVFAGLLGESAKELEGKHLLFTSGRPVGIPDLFGQYGISVASFFTPGGGIRMSQPIPQGTTLALMQSEPDDLVAAGKEAFVKALSRGSVERPAAGILFSCAIHQKLLGERIGEEIASIVNIAPGVPLAGFYSFGEQGLAECGVNQHNNAVITTLVIGKDLSYAARVASENIVLRQQLEQTILDIKKQEKTTREAEKNYRAIFENAREGIYRSTPEGRFLDVNPAMAKMYGYGSPEEMTSGVRPAGGATFVIREEWEELKRVLSAQSETGDFEVEQRRKDGATFWASLRVHAVYGEDGRTLCWEGRCIDITKRKRAEDSVRRQTQFLEILLETIPNPIFHKDRDGRYTGCNRAFENLLEMDREQIAGKTVYELWPKEMAEKYDQKDRELLEHPGEQHFECLVQRKNGEKRVAIVDKATMVDKEGHFRGLIGVISDITDQKRTEQALSQKQTQLEAAVLELEQARNMLQLVIESIPIRVFWKDRDSNFLGCNSAFAGDAGLDFPHELQGKDDFSMNWSEQAPLYRADDRLVMASGRPKMNYLEQQTTPSGSKIWVSTSKVPLRLPGGEVFGVLGVYEDITERKRAEEQIRQSENQYRHLFELTHDGIVLADMSGHIMAANRAFCELTGRPLAWLLESRLGDFESERSRALAPDHFMQLETEGQASFDIEIIRPGGALTFSEVKARAVDWFGRKAILGVARDITDSRRAEQALADSELRFRSVVDQAADAFSLMDEQQRFVDVNQAACKSLGYTREELLSMFLHEVVPRARTSDNSRKILNALFSGRKLRFETLHRRKDGTSFPVEVSTSLLESGGQRLILGLARDISERVAAEEKLRESSGRITALFSATTDSVILLDTEGNILAINDTGANRRGLEPQSLVGRALRDTLPASCAEVRMAKIKEIVGTGRPTVFEETRDGLLYSIRMFPVFDKDGGVSQVATFSRDVTEFKRAEEEKASLEAQLRQAQKMEAIGNLAGGIAHDFNNILSPIICYTEMAMADLPETAPMRYDLSQVRTAALRAKELVGQILSFSHRGEQPLMRIINVSTVFKEVLKLIRATLPSSIEIRQRLQPVTVLGDATQIHQIILNLCTNAAHAMEDSGILDAALEEVSLDAGNLGALTLRPGRYLKMSVRDTGCGMSEATVARIFEPYFTTKEVGKGTGLGLAVVHGIVKTHGGEIRVTSEIGRGSLFEVFIPAAQPRINTEVTPSCELPGGRERILLVDDEETLTDLGSKVLEQLGYNVTAITNPEEALELFRSGPDSFDLLITDYTMPKMVGTVLAQECLRLRPEVPIIICTGFSERIDEDKAAEAGIRGFLSKPLDRKLLAELVRKVLDNARG